MDEKEKAEAMKPKMRQIVIETDGTNVVIKKAEVVGLIEFNGILSLLTEFINTPKKAPKLVEKINDPTIIIPEVLPEEGTLVEEAKV